MDYELKEIQLFSIYFPSLPTNYYFGEIIQELLKLGKTLNIVYIVIVFLNIQLSY